MKHEYYELRKIKPRLKRLRELLQENVYSGWECEGEEEHQGKKVGWREAHRAKGLGVWRGRRWDEGKHPGLVSWECEGKEYGMEGNTLG